MEDYVIKNLMHDLPLWEQVNKNRVPLSFDLEVTARCNNDCRHCYINLPAGDEEARQRELSLADIDSIASQAVEMGALWCLITGGEPLLREDFADIYLLLKRKGLLVSVFSNACLVNEAHVALFKKYPPRDVEVTVYGATQATYERVTRKAGSYQAFRRGLDLLISSGVKVRLKAMAIRSNVNEMEAISWFCRSLSSDYYRFDPLLHLRYDGSPIRNAEILQERLSPEEITDLERADSERSAAMQKNCGQHDFQQYNESGRTRLFRCGAGESSFSVRYDGMFRICSTLNHPDCMVDLRNTGLADAWQTFAPKVRAAESDSREFRKHCQNCALINLCLWCPATAHLEVGRMDGHSDYFCAVAKARARAVQKLQPTIHPLKNG